MYPIPPFLRGRLQNAWLPVLAFLYIYIYYSGVVVVELAHRSMLVIVWSLQCVVVAVALQAPANIHDDSFVLPLRSVIVRNMVNQADSVLKLNVIDIMSYMQGP